MSVDGSAVKSKLNQIGDEPNRSRCPNDLKFPRTSEYIRRVAMLWIKYRAVSSSPSEKINSPRMHILPSCCILTCDNVDLHTE